MALSPTAVSMAQGGNATTTATIARAGGFTGPVAVAVTGALDADPLWGLLVGAPSSGKTEAIRALDDVAAAKVDDLTPAGLIGWTGSPTKGKATGLLMQVGEQAFATISDLSSLLAGSKGGARDDLYALLRRAYDGHVVRSIGSAPKPLVWRGRLTLLAAVTPAIDQYTSHADALGPRWLYIRLPSLRGEARRHASRMAREHGAQLNANRTRTRALAAAVVEAGAERVAALDLSADAEAALDDAAAVACLGRATIERQPHGRRDILSIPIIEETPRIVGQLSLLARGLLAMGLDEPRAVALARRAALDTMPQPRRRVLSALATGEPATTAHVAEAASMHWNVARLALEDLEAVGVCARHGDRPLTHDDDAPDRRPWRLGHGEGQLIGHVFNA
jgi:hypothetical protein